jgi:hypothetical protein
VIIRRLVWMSMCLARLVPELTNLCGAPAGAITIWPPVALNAWCELSGRKLSGRCPRFRVGLLPDPEGKGTGLSW